MRGALASSIAARISRRGFEPFCRRSPGDGCARKRHRNCCVDEIRGAAVPTASPPPMEEGSGPVRSFPLPVFTAPMARISGATVIRFPRRSRSPRGTPLARRRRRGASSLRINSGRAVSARASPRRPAATRARAFPIPSSKTKRKPGSLRRRSRHSRPQAAAQSFSAPPGKLSRFEDHLVVLDDQLLVQEQLHRLRQHLAFEGAAFRLDVVERVLPHANRKHVL